MSQNGESHSTEDDETHFVQIAGEKEVHTNAVIREDKPKPAEQPAGFHGKTNKERERRILLVQECVDAKLSVKHIGEFLPTKGLKLSAEQINRYLQFVRKPRGYKRLWSEMRIHDRYAADDFVRIALDAAKSGAVAEEMACGTIVNDKLRLRPDFRWKFGRWGFLEEQQLSSTSKMREGRRLREYVRLYELIGPLRAMFIMHKESEVKRIRQWAREVLKETRHPILNIFLFVCRDDFVKAGNTACDAIWLGAWNERKVTLLY